MVSAFCSARCMVCSLCAINCMSFGGTRRRTLTPLSRVPKTSVCPLDCCEFMLLEGRGNNVKGANLGRSLDKSCQCLQHLRIGIGVVVVGIFLVFPQADRNYINSAGTSEGDFVLKAILFAKQRQDVFVKSSRVIGQHIRFQMDRDITCKHINLLKVVG